MTDPKVSVIITSFNEGDDLEVTATLCAYADRRPWEVIVVDDCSTIRPVGSRLKALPRVRAIQTLMQNGCAQARRFGVDHADGDLIVLLDSHMRMQSWWLDAIVEAHLKHPNAILCPGCAAFDTNWRTTFVGYGATFQNDDPSIEPIWLPRGDVDAIDTCPCIMGACYVIPRHIWEALSGINPNFYGWGYDEQDLSLRAWLYGFEVRRINRMTVSHRWNRTNPGFAMNSWHAGYNALVTCATLFEDGVFEERFRPFLPARFPAAEAWHRFERQCESITAFRREVQHFRRRSDADLAAMNVYTIPTVEQQHARLDSYRAKHPT